ncbi:SDR family oxidoreductase [Bacillus sp. BRMEA1]|uniref:SDR family NAD(P)-dependent oxidoreductase n=1 Tax=Neobacillus endophyticus TaxID=2738405 RepID=UPI001566B47F|nr:SDR family oxidoreductase [Neobacillus endophyticus]NRD78215.1 SDR family oxidoreductase [Neobacillus endophyticus]
MKSIIITGAGSGLGKELALFYSKEGYQLLLTGRTIKKLIGTKNEIEASGGKAVIFPMDISNSESVNRTIQEMMDQYHVYGLVNNAGVGHFGPFFELSEREINEMLDTNIKGTIMVTHAVLPYLLSQKEGRILTIISTAGLRSKVNESVYCASKFALRGFTESLQKELKDSKIKINAVYMGGMDTPFWSGSDHVKDKSRFRTAKEVAEIIFSQLDQEEIIIESKKS